MALRQPRAFVIQQTCDGQVNFTATNGALGFYHRRVFLPVLIRAFANFSLLSLLSPKMRSQSLGESTEPHAEAILVQLSLRLRCRCRCRCRCRGRCRCRCRSSVIFVSRPTNGHYDFYKTWVNST